MSARDDLVEEVTELLLPMLKQRRTRNPEGLCEQIADAFIPFVVAVRDGTLSECVGVIEESHTMAEAKARIGHRRSNQ